MKKNLESTLYFYQENKLSSVKQGERSRTVFRYEHAPLAEQDVDASSHSSPLLASDIKASVLGINSGSGLKKRAYMAYGYDPQENEVFSVQSFNGESRTPFGFYLLGNGYRAYNPVLMRFNSPDSHSPFGPGGINAFSYCLGDPVNNVDPSGRITVSAYLFRKTRTGFSHPSPNLTLDRPPFVNAPQKKDAPPPYHRFGSGLSEVQSPPAFKISSAPLPAYSKRIPKGHTGWVNTNVGEKASRPASPPSYSAFPPPPTGTRTSLPPEQLASYRAELKEIKGQLKRLTGIASSLQSQNIPIPQTHLRTLNSLTQQRDFIRDLINH